MREWENESVLRHAVPSAAPADRLDRYLARLIPKSSRVQIQRWIADGRVQVNGKRVKPSHRIAPAEEILVEPPPPEISTLKPEAIPLAVLYEDDQLLVVDKPAGLVVHPAPGHPTGTLVNALLGRGGKLSKMAGGFKPGIVHRLDKDTSGLILVAKDDETHRALSEQFASGEVEKVYLALVKGSVAQDEGTIEAAIGRHPVKRQQMAVREDTGRRAVTRYKVLKRLKGATLLELYPKTGRTHQLRVHLAHLGHPILGDARYGLQAGLPRQFLHAHRLKFLHPAKNRWLTFTSPLPPDLVNVNLA
ncbi:MAG: RluA family pseudouridine synthase [Candidatus Omnitrophica bacterium]|nr:RluA family pseudouridine synthase [Candidatus Omnitrophota bacterium]